MKDDDLQAGATFGDFLIHLTDRFTTLELSHFFGMLAFAILVAAALSPFVRKPHTVHRHYHEHNYDPDGEAPTDRDMERAEAGGEAAVEEPATVRTVLAGGKGSAL